MDRRDFLKCVGAGGATMGIGLVFGYPAISNAETKNISQEFLEKLDKYKELFYVKGTDYAFVENIHDFLTIKIEPRLNISYDVETKGGEVIGLKKGLPLILRDENYGYLWDTDLGGRVNKYITKDGKALNIEKLPSTLQAQLQKRYENGLDLLISIMDFKAGNHAPHGICKYDGMEAACDQLLVYFQEDVTSRQIEGAMSIIKKNDGHVIFQMPEIRELVVEIKPEKKLFELKEKLIQSGYVVGVGLNGLIKFY